MKVVEQDDVGKARQVLQTGLEIRPQFDGTSCISRAGGLNGHSGQVGKGGANDADGVAGESHGR